MTDDLASHTTSLLLTETSDEGVYTLTLNDPPTRNALGPELSELLLEAVARFAREDDLRALVLTGAGSAFCSGANVRGFAQRIAEQSTSAPDGATPARPTPWESLDPVYTARETGEFEMGPEIVRRLHNLQKPSIAAVNGAAYGLGSGIALSCDFRVAGRSARFNEAFVRNGLVPADGSTWQLPKLVGLSNALWMQFSGESVDADEAYRIGLVNRVAEDDELMLVAVGMATKLAKGAVYAMGLIKQLIHQGYNHDLSQQLPIASRAQDFARATYDHQEGVAAFLEKREPQFRGY